jgi:predicted Rossmann-fold nucleotide-binding protein
MERVPVILFGEQFWRRAIDLDFLAEQGTISPGTEAWGLSFPRTLHSISRASTACSTSILRSY